MSVGGIAYHLMNVFQCILNIKYVTLAELTFKNVHGKFGCLLILWQNDISINHWISLKWHGEKQYFRMPHECPQLLLHNWRISPN